MSRIPIWIIAIVTVLAVALFIVGFEERHEIGPVPMGLGALWVLWVLASAPKIFRQD